MLPNSTMTNKYKRVRISSIFKRNTRKIICDEEEYMKKPQKMNRSQGGLCKIVGLNDYQVRPYFDIDFKNVRPPALCLNTVLCVYCLDRRACTISLLGLSIGWLNQWMTEHPTQVLG
jgi:hypothetical protein